MSKWAQYLSLGVTAFELVEKIKELREEGEGDIEEVVEVGFDFLVEVLESAGVEDSTVIQLQEVQERFAPIVAKIVAEAFEDEDEDDE